MNKYVKNYQISHLKTSKVLSYNTIMKKDIIVIILKPENDIFYFVFLILN